jgi:hypothetical protein
MRFETETVMASQSPEKTEQGISGAPNEQNLLRLMERTGYSKHKFKVNIHL